MGAGSKGHMDEGMSHIRDLIARVDEERLRSDLFQLAEDPLPYRKLNYTVPGHGKNTLYEADDFLETQLAACGYQAIREACQVQACGLDTSKPRHHQYAPPPAGAPFLTAYNLYFERTGRTIPHETIILLAHKDSQSWVDSPGAYDNGAGVISVLEIARVLAAYDPARTIQFLFCNEEHTPWTSIQAARNARERGDNLAAVFNVDSVGGKPDHEIAAGLKPNVTLYSTPAGKILAELMAFVNERFEIGLAQRMHERPYPNDDDGSYVKAGYDAVVANIGSFPYDDSQYHLEGDVPERVDFENVRMAAQATLAAVLVLDSRP